MATKMSKEEKAVRDALAAVQAGAGVPKADETLGVKPPVPAANQPLGGISDIDTSTAYGKKSAEILKQAQAYVDKTQPSIVKKAADLGYDVNPVTGALTPTEKKSTNVSPPPSSLTVDEAVNKAITALNATWQAKFDALTTKQTETNRATTTTALEDFKANLKLAGLDTLASTIDDYIKQDLTASQIKINLLGTPAYKNRFPGMAALSAAGKAVNEATYISMERGMVSVLKAYGLDDKVFGTTTKLGEVIGNQVSVTEFENRVQMATDKVQKNTDVLAALNEYYGVDLAGAVSYLLDSKTGMDVVKKQIRASELGAAAEMYQFDLSKAQAESYINVSGTSDLNALKESFGKARLLADTQTRLSQIEGTQYNELEAVAAQLGQDQQRQLESQRRALREQARFAGQSGVTTASLRKESTI